MAIAHQKEYWYTIVKYWKIKNSRVPCDTHTKNGGEKKPVTSEVTFTPKFLPWKLVIQRKQTFALPAKEEL